MKPTVLSLLIAAGAFGASTVYLARQLDEERTRADQVLAETQALQARIAELENLRATWEVMARRPDRSAKAADEKPVAVEMNTPPGTGLAAPGIVGMDAASSSTARVMPIPSPEESKAFQKMMRSQLRAQNRRLYAGIGDKLGLSREDAHELIDLLTDQQVGAISAARAGQRAAATRPRNGGELQQKQLTEVAELIGYDKLELFKDFQKSMPARHEVAALSRQLEGVDLELDESQRERLVTVLSEERERIPAPVYVLGTSGEDHARALTAWQEDYQRRSEERVRSVLNSEQLSTYDEYQQWAREMRVQFESRRVMRAAEGNVTLAEPVAIAVPASP